MTISKTEVDDQEFKKVIADFLDLGHVDNIVALFRRDPHCYEWTGEILQDDRFSVRLGLSVLFEELEQIEPEKLPLAIPSLLEVLNSKESLLRGEAVSLLGIIGTDLALTHIRELRNDDSHQVREVVELVLEERS